VSSTMGLNILITGALGHIGSRLSRELSEKCPEIKLYLIDNLSTQRYFSLFNHPHTDRVQFLFGDILDSKLYEKIPSVDVVLHLAALTDAESSFKEPKRVEEINVGGTRLISDFCIKHSIPLIYFSTTSVYGSSLKLVTEDALEKDLNPQSPYATTKLNGEKMIQELGNSGLNYLILRMGTIFGFSPGMRFHTVVNKFCWESSLGLPLSVWKTAYLQKRPYLYLGDAIQAVLFLLNRGIYDLETYNVLTLNTTVQNIVETIQEFLPETQINTVDSLAMNQLSYEVSDQKFKELGFKSAGNLRDGIKEVLDQLKINYSL